MATLTLIRTQEYCEVANQGCECPSNLTLDRDEPGVETICFACGLPVCRGICCSVERDYLGYGVQRICADCELLHFADAALGQRQRAYQEAGYADWFLLGAREYAEGLLRKAEKAAEEIYRIARAHKLKGTPSSFRAFSERARRG
jgi:hypothetical protein